MGFLTPIKDGDDLTAAIIKALAVVAVCGLLILLLLLVWQFVFPSPRLARAEIAVHNEATFALLQAKHGKKATQVVVYEEDGRAFYYPQGPVGPKMELR